ncbi:MAG: BamA/TamA family outer membrane protein [Elusimicrobiota bacterium]
MSSRAAASSAALWAGLLLAPALGVSNASANDRAPCPAVAFTSTATIRLGDAERKLLCGDPKTEGWRTIPLNQAEYFMSAFLQQRGYQNPSFAVQEGVLEVDAGPKSRINALDVTGLPPGANARSLRKIVGQDLTPKELDVAKTALVALLQNHGYPCPEITLSADSVTGVVDAAAVPGAPGLMCSIEPARLEMVDPRVFDRYRAFHCGPPFDMRLLSLTARRTVADALFVSAYYDVACSTAGASIAHRVVEGKPRLYQLGAGFDTEGYAIGKAQWKKSRIGWRDSSLEGSLYASFREETAEASMHAYVDPASRLFFMPQAILDREDQLQYQYVTEQALLQPGTSWESESLRADVLAGPLVEHITTVRGVGPANDTFLAFHTKWTLTDHLYEYYAAEPRRGWTATVETLSRLAGADSILSADRVTLKGEALWNVGGCDPPAFVVGTRYWLGTTYAPDAATAQAYLGPDMRFFLGGDANLRGVALTGLPNDQYGFFTVAYDGLELRMGDVLPYGLEPLVFIDAAMAGRSDVHLDPDVYYSPGAGLRWRLPVGSIRGTVARGLIWDRDPATPPLYAPHWQLFLSFGEEF